MKIKNILLSALAASVAILPSMASAQHAWPLVYKGEVYVQKGPIGFFCDFTVEFTATQVTVNSDETNPALPCGSFAINNPLSYTFDHPVAPATHGDLTVSGFNVVTSLTPGDCLGALVAQKNADEIIIDTFLAGGAPTYLNCNLAGILERQ